MLTATLSIYIEYLCNNGSYDISYRLQGYKNSCCRFGRFSTTFLNIAFWETLGPLIRDKISRDKHKTRPT